MSLTVEKYLKASHDRFMIIFNHKTLVKYARTCLIHVGEKLVQPKTKLLFFEIDNNLKNKVAFLRN